MGIEGYGGSCPHCEKAMLQKWESSGGFMFDACVWCGFATGTCWIESDAFGVYIGNATQEYIWDALFEHHNVETREELREDLNLEPYVSEADSEFWPSIFDHSKIHTVKEKRVSFEQALHTFNASVDADLRDKINAAFDAQSGDEPNAENPS